MVISSKHGFAWYIFPKFVTSARDDAQPTWKCILVLNLKIAFVRLNTWILSADGFYILDSWKKWIWNVHPFRLTVCDRDTQQKLHRIFRATVSKWKESGLVSRAVLTYRFPNGCDVARLTTSSSFRLYTKIRFSPRWGRLKLRRLLRAQPYWAF